MFRQYLGYLEVYSSTASDNFLSMNVELVQLLEHFFHFYQILINHWMWYQSGSNCVVKAYGDRNVV